MAILKILSKNTIEITLQIISPMTMFMLGVLFIMFLILIAPVNFLYLGTPYSWIYLELCIIFLLLGITTGMKGILIKSTPITISINAMTLKQIFYLGIFLASFGAILRIIDRYYIRGASISKNVFENREIVSETGINFFSVLSSFFYPVILLLPFLYLLLYQARIHSFRHTFILSLLALFYITDSILFGSRSILMIWMFLILLYLYVFNILKFKVTKNSLTLFFILSILFFIANGYMFDHRTSLMGMEAYESTQISVYAYFLPLDDFYVSLLESNKGNLFYFFILGIVNFIQYMVHGLFELFYLVDNFDTDNMLLGEQNFAVVIKFIYKIFQIPFSFTDNAEVLVRTGIYNTLFGPLYYDFGWGATVFSLILGLMIGFISKKALSGDLFLLPLQLYFLLLLFFALIVDTIIFAQGIYNMVAFSIFYFLSKFLFIPKRRYTL